MLRITRQMRPWVYGYSIIFSKSSNHAEENWASLNITMWCKVSSQASTRLVSPRSVLYCPTDRFSDAKGLIQDLILTLLHRPGVRVTPSRHGQTSLLADLFHLGSIICWDRFDKNLTVPLIEGFLSHSSARVIDNLISQLITRAASHSPIRSLRPSPKEFLSVAAHSTDFLAGSDPLLHVDEEVLPASKRPKVHDAPGKLTSKSSLNENKIQDGNGSSGKLNSNSTPVFCYQPLDPSRKELRMLILQPAEDFWSPSRSYSLIHVSMDDELDYEALSYTWGSGTEMREVLVNGVKFSIASNLAEALENLSEDATRVSRTLWVDAICINQKDKSERSQQVGMMAEIYSRAKKVVVWLGGVDVLQQILLYNLDRIFRHPQTDEEMQTLMADNENKRLMDDLAKNPWFKRIWVVQEVAVAQDVTIQAQLTTISWSAFSAALRNCQNIHSLKSVFEAVSMINMIRQRHTRGDGSTDLFDLLDQFRHCLATDERDKVFALLGLASPSLKYHKAMLIKPDYSLSAVKVFRFLCRDYIAKRRDLDILCHANFLPRLPGFSSWVPAWSFYEPGLSVLPKRQTNSPGFPRPMYRCCGDTTIDPDLLLGTESSDKLWVNGFQFDVVTVVGGVADHPQDLGLETALKISRTELFREWQTLSEISKELYGKDTEECFQRTLVADAVGNERWGDGGIGATAPSVLVQADPSLETTGKAAPIFIGQKTQDSTFANPPMLKEHSQIRSDLREAAIKRATVKRQFYVTEKGYMGLGPAAMEVGDLVYVLAGGQVPFILRTVGTPNSGQFHLVGESYLHGIMDGEATEMRVNLGIELETICLV